MEDNQLPLSDEKRVRAEKLGKLYAKKRNVLKKIKKLESGNARSHDEGSPNDAISKRSMDTLLRDYEVLFEKCDQLEKEKQDLLAEIVKLKKLLIDKDKRIRTG